MTQAINLYSQGKLLFVVSHYTEKTLDIIEPLTVIDKHLALKDFYKELLDAEKQQIVPFQVYSQIVKKLLLNAPNNPVIIKFIETLISQFNR